MDDNLKLAIIQALVERGNLAGLVTRAKAKRTGHGQRLEKAVRKALLALALDPAELASITKLEWFAASPIISTLWETWDGEDDTFDLHDLRGIEACPNLVKLVLGETCTVTSFMPLATLRKLKTISCWGGATRVDDLAPLAALTKLGHLRVAFTGSELAPLAGLEALETLDLGHETAVSDLGPLLGLKKLRKVEIVRKQLGGPDDSLAKENVTVVKALQRRGVELVLDDRPTPVREFGADFVKPAPKTAVPLSKLGLAGVDFLEVLASEVGTGVFREGAFSICSVREVGLDLDGWRTVKGFPTGARHFATNWLGELFFVGPKGRIYKLFPHEPCVEEIRKFRSTPFLEEIARLSDDQRWEEYSKLGRWTMLYGPDRPTLAPKQVCTLDNPVEAADSFARGFKAEALAKTLARLAARVLT